MQFGEKRLSSENLSTPNAPGFHSGLKREQRFQNLHPCHLVWDLILQPPLGDSTLADTQHFKDISEATPHLDNNGAKNMETAAAEATAKTKKLSDGTSRRRKRRRGRI